MAVDGSEPQSVLSEIPENSSALTVPCWSMNPQGFPTSIAMAKVCSRSSGQWKTWTWLHQQQYFPFFPSLTEQVHTKHQKLLPAKLKVLTGLLFASRSHGADPDFHSTQVWMEHSQTLTLHCPALPSSASSCSLLSAPPEVSQLLRFIILILEKEQCSTAQGLHPNLAIQYQRDLSKSQFLVQISAAGFLKD